MAAHFKGRISPTLPYRLVTIRPVDLKGQRQLQFSYFTERQNIVKNYPVGNGQAAPHLEELLGLPFSSLQLQTLNEDLNYQVQQSKRESTAPLVARAATCVLLITATTGCFSSLLLCLVLRLCSNPAACIV